MKLSKRTVSILKNFASINQSIVIHPGNVISTISNTRDMYAKTEVEETFDHQVAIYDLNEFLNFIGLAEDPDLEFTDTGVKIADNNVRQYYSYADAEIITTPPEKGVSLPSVEVEASLSRDQLDKTKKAASLLSADEITFTNGDLKIANNLSGNNLAISDVAQHDVDYSLSIGVDKLRMVLDDYDVKLCAKGLAQFEGKQSNITYAVALRPDGKYSA